jgi:hypothetical protein
LELTCERYIGGTTEVQGDVEVTPGLMPLRKPRNLHEQVLSSSKGEESTFCRYIARPAKAKGVVEAAYSLIVERPLTGPLQVIASSKGEAKLLFFPGLAKGVSYAFSALMKKLRFPPAKRQISMGAWKKNRFPRPLQVAWCKHNAPSWADWKQETKQLCNLLAETNEEHFPEMHNKQVQVCKRAEADGLDVCTPFTTVTLNAGRAANGRPHHHRENAKGVMQWLAYFGKFDGGELVLPDFKLKIEVQDGDVVAFLGEEIVHAVEPFRGERFCPVYWVCGGLWKWYGIEAKQPMK